MGNIVLTLKLNDKIYNITHLFTLNEYSQFHLKLRESNSYSYTPNHVPKSCDQPNKVEVISLNRVYIYLEVP